MRQELGRHPDTDDFYVEVGGCQPLGGFASAQEPPDEAVQEEVSAGRTQDKRFEDGGKEDKHPDEHDEKYDDTPEDAPTEHLQMVPEGHLLVGSLCHATGPASRPRPWRAPLSSAYPP